MQGLSLYLVSFNVKIMFPRLSISLMKISAGLSDVKLCGKIRCVLHLVDVIPMVGSVEIMFLHSPEVMVSFDLVLMWILSSLKLLYSRNHNYLIFISN